MREFPSKSSYFPPQIFLPSWMVGWRRNLDSAHFFSYGEINTHLYEHADCCYYCGEETCSNILRRDFCFPDEYFLCISHQAKEFISSLYMFFVSKNNGLTINFKPQSLTFVDYNSIIFGHKKHKKR